MKLYHETVGDGDCFFHAAYGDLSQDKYKAPDASSMREAWHAVLRKFDSLNDPKMPTILRDALHQLFSAVFDAPEHFETFDYSKTGAVKTKIDEINNRFGLLIKGFERNIRENQNIRNQIFECLYEEIRREIQEEDKKKMSNKTDKEKMPWLDKEKGTSTQISYDDRKNDIEAIFLGDKKYLQNKLRENYKSIFSVLYPSGHKKHKDKTQLDKLYNSEGVIENYIVTEDFYNKYLKLIISYHTTEKGEKIPDHYVTTEEISILAAISKTRVYVFGEINHHPNRYSVKRLFWDNNEFDVWLDKNFKEYKPKPPWNKEGVVAIYHNGLDHYSRGFKEILDLADDNANKDKMYFEFDCLPESREIQLVIPKKGIPHAPLMMDIHEAADIKVVKVEPSASAPTQQTSMPASESTQPTSASVSESARLSPTPASKTTGKDSGMETLSIHEAADIKEVKVEPTTSASTQPTSHTASGSAQPASTAAPGPIESSPDVTFSIHEAADIEEVKVEPATSASTQPTSHTASGSAQPALTPSIQPSSKTGPIKIQSKPLTKLDIHEGAGSENDAPIDPKRSFIVRIVEPYFFKRVSKKPRREDDTKKKDIEKGKKTGIKDKNAEERHRTLKRICCFWDICGYFTRTEVRRVPLEKDPELMLRDIEDYNRSRVLNIKESIGYTSMTVALLVGLLEAVRVLINQLEHKKADDLSSPPSIILHFVIVVVPIIGAFFERCFKTTQATAEADMEETEKELKEFKAKFP